MISTSVFKRFEIRIYIFIAVFCLILPVIFISVLLPESESKLILTLLLGLVFLVIPIFILTLIISSLYSFVKKINGTEKATHEEPVFLIYFIRLMGFMPFYHQLKQLSSKYRVLYLENQMLYNNLEKDKEHSDILYKTTDSLVSSYKLNNALDVSVKTIYDLTKCDSCSIMIFDKKKGLLKNAAFVGLSKDVMDKVVLKPGQGIAGKVFLDKKPILVKDISKDSQFKFPQEQKVTFRSVYSVPLVTSDKCIGIININTKTPLPEDKCRLVETVASQISMAIKNALLFKSMEELAIRDSLTGLYNHRYFKETLAKEMDRALRYKRPLSLVIMDIDNFKQYNDNYGHMFGDYLLKEIGRVIQNNLRTSDVLARYGGDELAVILPETDEESAYTLLERIRKKIFKYQLITPEVFSNTGSSINKKTNNLLIRSSTIWGRILRLLKKVNHSAQTHIDNDHNVNVTVSAGICSLSKTIISKEDLIKKADEALLKAKRIGKNQICIYGTGLGKQ